MKNNQQQKKIYYAIVETALKTAKIGGVVMIMATVLAFGGSLKLDLLERKERKERKERTFNNNNRR